MKPQMFKCPDGGEIAYHKTDGETPGVIFLGGFRSDMTGSKAMALEEFCKERGQQFIRFDYFGHGESGGAFVEGTIGRWADNAIAVLDELAGGKPQILVGSSMGGWLMLLVALKRPKKVAGLLGIAAAPDFTELLMWDKFTPEQQTEMREKGVIEIPNCYDEEPYKITMNLIAESGEHLVLDGNIDINCPVMLVHGMKDEDVPWEFAMTLNEKLASKDVRTLLVDDGDHRMSSEKHLKIIRKQLNRMLDELSQQEDAA
ncbi:MAG: alpha/beta hydrolase [Rickettsiales bacterium]|nr:alpha/beta hydrolase [Rickettsiales bacterium]